MKPDCENKNPLVEAYEKAKKALHEKCIDLGISSNDTQELLKSIPPPPSDPPGGKNP